MERIQPSKGEHLLRLRTIVLAAALMSISACGGKDKAEPTKSDDSPEVEVFTGPLSAELLKEAPYAVASAEYFFAISQAQQFIGKPTHTDDARKAWAMIEGDTCLIFTLVNNEGKAETAFKAIEKTDSEEHAKCVAAVAKK